MVRLVCDTRCVSCTYRYAYVPIAKPFCLPSPRNWHVLAAARNELLLLDCVSWPSMLSVAAAVHLPPVVRCVAVIGTWDMTRYFAMDDWVGCGSSHARMFVATPSPPLASSTAPFVHLALRHFWCTFH